MLGSSPSQMMATWSPRVARCRSRQFTAAFNVPSSNHLIDTSPSKDVFLIRVGAFIQVMRLHSSAQNASGAWAARAYISLYCDCVTRAAAAISALMGTISASDIPLLLILLLRWSIMPKIHHGRKPAQIAQRRTWPPHQNGGLRTIHEER